MDLAKEVYAIVKLLPKEELFAFLLCQIKSEELLYQYHLILQKAVDVNLKVK